MLTQFLLLLSSFSVRMVHLQCTMEWSHIAPSARGIEAAVLSTSAELSLLHGGCGSGGIATAPSRELEELLLPVRHGEFALQVTTELDDYAAIPSSVASAQLIMAAVPLQF
jgi:hypothetical protein